MHIIYISLLKIVYSFLTYSHSCRSLLHHRYFILMVLIDLSVLCLYYSSRRTVWYSFLKNKDNLYIRFFRKIEKYIINVSVIYYKELGYNIIVLYYRELAQWLWRLRIPMISCLQARDPRKLMLCSEYWKTNDVSSIWRQKTSVPAQLVRQGD